MGNKINKQDIAAAEADVEFEKEVDKMAGLLIEGKKEEFESDFESFESYAQRVREELHEEMADFRDSFLRGYEILMDEITRKEEENKSKGKLPPGYLKL